MISYTSNQISIYNKKKLPGTNLRTLNQSSCSRDLRVHTDKHPINFIWRFRYHEVKGEKLRIFTLSHIYSPAGKSNTLPNLNESRITLWKLLWKYKEKCQATKPTRSVLSYGYWTNTFPGNLFLPSNCIEPISDSLT